MLDYPFLKLKNGLLKKKVTTMTLENFFGSIFGKMLIETSYETVYFISDWTFFGKFC